MLIIALLSATLALVCWASGYAAVRLWESDDDSVLGYLVFLLLCVMTPATGLGSLLGCLFVLTH